MKIRKLHLKNYKVFDDLELDFTDENGETLNEIVIAGVNGSGKTTVLEFIRDFLAVKKIDISNFEVELELNEGDNKRFHYTESYRKHYTWIESNDEGKILKINPNMGGMSYSLGQLPPLKEYVDELPIIIYRHSNDRFSNDEVSNIKEISFYSHKNEMKDIILKPIKNKVFENKEQPPKKVIEDEIKSINKVFKDIKLNSKFIDINDSELIFESLNGKKIHFEDLSNGEKFVYFMGFMLKRKNINNSMIIIDEPEDSLHPTWQQQILKFYSNIGENNQVILATHSPHIIGSAKSESVFLLKPENGKIKAYHPRYAKGHSVNYILSEIMETNPRENRIGKMVDEYLRLIERGMHETERGKELWQELEKLDPNSNERGRIRLALRRLEAIGK